MTGPPSGQFDLLSRGLMRVPSGTGRGGFEMNVVFLPALASSLASAVSDGVFCDQWTCLFGWAWSVAALMLVSAWFVQRWPLGSDRTDRRFQPAGATAARSCRSWRARFPHPATAPATHRVRRRRNRPAGSPTTDMATLPASSPADGRPSSPAPHSLTRYPSTLRRLGPSRYDAFRLRPAWALVRPPDPH
jgi:hypothetical protein